MEEDFDFKNIGRNEPCPCGSGKKFKKCHLPDIEAARASKATSDYKVRKKLILAAADFPVYKCLIGEDWKLHGLARVVVARIQPNGRLVYSAFLNDLFCLGVKDAFCNAEMSQQEFENIFLPAHFFNTRAENIGLDLAKSIVYGSIAYARNLGFEPDPDFNLASHLLGEVYFKPDPKIKFGGPNGKPLYIIGPNDNSRLIIAKLEKKLGKDGFGVFDPRD